MDSNALYISISPVRDRHNRRIILIHSDSLPSSSTITTSTPASTSQISDILHTLSETDVVLYLHAGLASSTGTSLWGVSSFRRFIDTLEIATENIPTCIYAVHVSFASRAHLAVAARFSGRNFAHMYAHLQYCDLLQDVEELLGVDSTVLGIRNIDFEYDEVMRAWVARQKDEDGNEVGLDGVHEKEQQRTNTRINPKKPLLNATDFSYGETPKEEQQRTDQQPFVIDQL